MSTNHLRTKWAAIGAAVAVTLGAGGIGIVNATSPSDAAALVPITPCRLIDSRPGADNVGPKTSPMGPAEVFTVNGHGDNGDCTGIPATATGLSLNVTALGATAPTFLTLWATGDQQPTASSLNPVPDAPPTPNAVVTGLSAGGQFDVYNLQGQVDVIIDVNGYYTDHHHDDRYYPRAETDALIAESQVMWARVATDATLIAGTPGVTAAEYTDQPIGRYVVTFPDSVVDCAYVVHNNANIADVATGLAYNTNFGPNEVFVYFEDEAGTAQDRSFSLMVMC